MPSCKCYIRRCVVVVLSCCFLSSFVCQELEAKVWGYASITGFGDLVNSHEPSTEGENLQAAEQNFGLAPGLAAGFEEFRFSKLRWDAFFLYQHYWLGIDGGVPFVQSHSSLSPDNLVEQRYLLRTNFSLNLGAYFETGLVAEFYAVEGQWRDSTWDSRRQLEFFPWLGWQWNQQNHSYFFAILARSVDPVDDEKSFKIEPQKFSDLSLRLTHVAKISNKFRFAGALFREKILYEDFNNDQQKTGGTIASEWTFLWTLSLITKIGFDSKEFLHPWRKVAGCNLQERSFVKSSYPKDPPTCRRWELESFYQVGLNWDIDPKFSLSANYSLLNRDASAMELQVLRQVLVLTLAWQTDENPLGDKLAEFVPWGYRELYN